MRLSGNTTQENIAETLRQYRGFPETFRYAHVGIPKSLTGLSEDFYGTYDAFIARYPKSHIHEKAPAVLYLHGSSHFNTGEIYRRYIVETVGAVFFAPDSTRIVNRPSYHSPAPEEDYIRVHKVRLAEIAYALEQFELLTWIDRDNLFLMGKSEGALAASIYHSDIFKGRIIVSFSCESSYFYSDFALGSKKHEPILNIIGIDDPYFSKKSAFNKGREVEGSGVITLRGNKNAKVVLLSKTKHDITQNPYVEEEIVGFLKSWIGK